MSSLINNRIIIQLFGTLMMKPSLLSETDKYTLIPEDFTTSFEKYVFASIYNLYINGAETITPQDIDTYLNDKPTCYAIFEKEKGVTYLQDALMIAEPENFDYYYNKFRKLKLVEDLRRVGYNTDNIYCDNVFNDNAEKINQSFEEKSLKDILNGVLKNITTLEEKYKVNQENKSYRISENIRDLVKGLNESPDVGNKLQGRIFNTVVRGARKGKYYIRSLASGVGKTRGMIGDACYLAFPYRFNSDTNSWEITGSNEKCLYFATEQELDEIQTLVLAYLTDINEEIILRGNYNDEVKIRLEQAVSIVEQYESNLLVVHMPDPTIEQVRTKVRYHFFKDNIGYLFYDYIFSSPGLLSEYRDLKIREDVVLMILSTALKNLAVELNIHVTSGTQLNDPNSDAGKRKEIKNQSLIRGAKAIVDKADIGCIGSNISTEELELLRPLINKYGIAPNQVYDIYKVRRGQYTGVRIWSIMDLGTCRKRDLFITNARYEEVNSFEAINYLLEYQKNPIIEKEVDKLNQDYARLLYPTDENGVVIEKETANTAIDWSSAF